MNRQMQWVVGEVVAVLSVLAMPPTCPAQLAGVPPEAGAGAGGVAAAARPTVDTQAVQAAFDRLAADAAQGKWFAHWNEQSSLPRMLRGGVSRAYDGAPADAATSFLNDNAALFALDRAGATSHITQSIEIMPTVHRVSSEQRYRGLPVAHAIVRLFITPQNEVRYVVSNAWPIAPDLAVEPTLTAQQANDRACELLPECAGTWEPPVLAVYPQGDGVLCYLMSRRLSERDLLPWELAIDARTGESLEIREVMQQAHDEDHARGSAKASVEPSSPSASLTDSAGVRVSKPTGTMPAAALGPPPPPCDRTWLLVGPAAGETFLDEVPDPEDPYHVVITMGASDVGSPEDATQAESVYGAGITLLPGVEYTFSFTYNLKTWDSYNATWGYWDVFFVHVNSLGFLWDHPLALPDHLSDNACSESWNPFHEDLQGPLWTWGGDQHSDGDLCGEVGFHSFTYYEPDHAKTVYLSLGLDTLVTGAVDGLMPSWGTIVMEITGQTKTFNPNPTTTLGNPTLTDVDDATSAVPIPAYQLTTLTNLDLPAANDPWMLTGDYAKLIEKPTKPGLTALDFFPPESRNGIFPYLRSCDAFEAVMAYRHVTLNQLYIQSLGYTIINNRQIEIDPHNFTQDNAFYIPSPEGAGYLIFGDGGVDDAEDADVIIHEYAHSIQDNSNPGAFLGENNPTTIVNETGALGEAFGDYWACSFYRDANLASGYNPALFADWDATNGVSPTGLRNLNNSMVYPRDITASIHATGQIWSGAMWTVMQFLGRPYTDRLTLLTNFAVPIDPNFGDAAVATLEADDLISGGVNKPGLVGGFIGRGIFRRMDATSAPAGAPIGVSVSDVLGMGGGTTPFSRAFRHKQFVTLTAPGTHSGRIFRYWQLDGVNLMVGATGIGFTMNDPTPPAMQLIRSAHAVYMVPGDVNGDGVVNVSDLLGVISAWGAGGPNLADVNGDGVVNIADLLYVIANWG